MVRRGITRLSQLKGKRIGVEKNANGAYFLSLILRAANISDLDVQIVSLPLNEQVDAYRKGLLDAVVTYRSVHHELQRLGAQSLFDSSKVPGKIVSVLAVRASDKVKYSAQLDVLIEAWFRGLKVIRQDPARAYPFMARRKFVPVSETEYTLRGMALLDQWQNFQQLYGEPAPLLTTAAEIQGVLKQAGLPAGSDDLADLVVPHILRSVAGGAEP